MKNNKKQNNKNNTHSFDKDIRTTNKQYNHIQQYSPNKYNSNYTRDCNNQYSSAVYDPRNSNDATSPRINQFIQKYKTYVQFINTNKINKQVQTNTPYYTKKKIVLTPTARRNSPIPYLKGRKSAFSRLFPSDSPKNQQNTLTQRNSFPKNNLKKQPKQNIFYVHGNNISKLHKRKQSDNNQIKTSSKNSKDNININININKSKRNKTKQTSKIQINSNHTYMYDRKNIERNKKKQQLLKNRSNNRNCLKDNSKEKNIINNKRKSSISNSHKSNNINNKSNTVVGENQKNIQLDLQEEKLANKLFKGIQFYRDLGKGAHALVKSAVDWNNKRKIAIKIYQKTKLSQQQLSSIQKQIQILLGISHPNIVKLYQIIQTFKTINLVMEYGGGNSLDQFIKSKPQGVISQQQAKLIFKQILQGVGYLHKTNITHRDIKTDNILLNKHLSLKIIDFGFSLQCQGNKNINSYCGTPTYMAPQVVSKIPHNPLLADRWSLGILLFTMLNGNCPFRAPTQKQLFQKIIKGYFQYQQEVSKQAKDLIYNFLKRNPVERINPVTALKHPWFTSK